MKTGSPCFLGVTRKPKYKGETTATVYFNIDYITRITSWGKSECSINDVHIEEPFKTIRQRLGFMGVSLD